MKIRMVSLMLANAVLCAAALAQSSALQLPSPLEKELAARASNVTEVTLGKNMLAFLPRT